MAWINLNSRASHKYKHAFRFVQPEHLHAQLYCRTSVVARSINGSNPKRAAPAGAVVRGIISLIFPLLPSVGLPCCLRIYSSAMRRGVDIMQGACDHYRLQVLPHRPDTPRLLNGCGSLLDERTEWTEWKTPAYQNRIGFCLIVAL